MRNQTGVPNNPLDECLPRFELF